MINYNRILKPSIRYLFLSNLGLSAFGTFEALTKYIITAAHFNFLYSANAFVSYNNSIFFKSKATKNENKSQFCSA